MSIRPYNELRKISSEKARELIRKIFEANNRNVSKTAKTQVLHHHYNFLQ